MTTVARSAPTGFHLRTFDESRLRGQCRAKLRPCHPGASPSGLPELVRQRLDLGDAPGRANTSASMMTLRPGVCPELFDELR